MTYKVDLLRLKKTMTPPTTSENLVKRIKVSRIYRENKCVDQINSLQVFRTNKIKYRRRRKHKVNYSCRDIKPIKKIKIFHQFQLLI